MPFVKEKFHVKHSIPAFLFVMRSFHCSQAEAQRLICKGRLLIEGESIYNPGTVLAPGTVEMVFFRPQGSGLKPLFQTADFMILEKPSGVLVHPNTMATPYSMLDEIRSISGERANAVHRIDMETSGLLLASKHKKAEHFLKNAFEIKKIQKSYLAWVAGEISDSFSVEQSIKINTDYSLSKHKVSIDSSGKAAKTDFVPIRYDKTYDATLLACYPLTGRTHQIRIHLFHMKHPILGDPIYGCDFQTANAYLDGTLSKQERRKRTGASRLMLHAQSLQFRYGAEYFIESKVNFAQERAQLCPKADRQMRY